jgi:hypothetical protein
MSSFRKSDKNPIQLGIDENLLTRPCEVAAAFATHFRSVSKNRSIGEFSTDFSSCDSLPIAPVSDSHFMKATRRPCPSKFVGIDGIIRSFSYI